MHKTVKALHLVGLAMFLGSILGHVTVGFLPGARDPGEAMLFGRQAIEIATWSLTIPGLALLAVTGVALSLRRDLGLGRRRWLSVHQGIGLLIVANAAIVLVPGGAELLDLASALAGGDGSADAFAALAARERTFGAVNLTLALVTVFVAILKPTLGQPRR